MNLRSLFQNALNAVTFKDKREKNARNQQRADDVKALFGLLNVNFFIENGYDTIVRVGDNCKFALYDDVSKGDIRGARYLNGIGKSYKEALENLVNKLEDLATSNHVLLIDFTPKHLRGHPHTERHYRVEKMDEDTPLQSTRTIGFVENINDNVRFDPHLSWLYEDAPPLTQEL